MYWDFVAINHKHKKAFLMKIFIMMGVGRSREGGGEKMETIVFKHQYNFFKKKKRNVNPATTV